jgi:hypothetical protein
MAVLFNGLPAQAAVLYTGGPYNQNFNSLPNTPINTSLGASPVGWTDDNPAPPAGNFSIVGWHLWHPTVQAEGGANDHQRMRIGAGVANTGSFMSFGDQPNGFDPGPDVTDRALGMLSSNTMAPTSPSVPPEASESYYGALFRNDTKNTLTQFTLDYYGEQWRDGGGATPSLPQSITFAYKVTAAPGVVQDTGFTPHAALDFTSPSFGGTSTSTGSDPDTNAAARDGNAAANRTLKADTIFGLNWGAGEYLWIRWTDINDAGNDHGLGIDDCTFSARRPLIPEPSSMVLAGLGALAALAVARRRK